MSTKEFIVSIENLGFKIDSGSADTISIFDENTDKIAQVSSKIQWCLWINSLTDRVLLEEDREHLFNILVEYSSTPVDARENYFIRHKYLKERYNYLALDSNKEYFFVSNDNIDGLKKKFTLKELPMWVHVMLDKKMLIMEEV